MRPKRHLSVDDKHRKWLCIIPEFMRHEEHKRWNEHLHVYYCTLHANVTPKKFYIAQHFKIKGISAAKTRLTHHKISIKAQKCRQKETVKTLMKY